MTANVPGSHWLRKKKEERIKWRGNTHFPEERRGLDTAGSWKNKNPGFWAAPRPPACLCLRLLLRPPARSLINRARGTPRAQSCINFGTFFWLKAQRKTRSSGQVSRSTLDTTRKRVFGWSLECVLRSAFNQKKYQKICRIAPQHGWARGFGF